MSSVSVSSLLMLVALLMMSYARPYALKRPGCPRPYRSYLKMVGLDSNRDVQGVAGSNIANKVPKPGDRKTFKRFMQVLFLPSFLPSLLSSLLSFSWLQIFIICSIVLPMCRSSYGGHQSWRICSPSCVVSNQHATISIDWWDAFPLMISVACRDPWMCRVKIKKNLILLLIESWKPSFAAQVRSALSLPRKMTRRVCAHRLWIIKLSRVRT